MEAHGETPRTAALWSALVDGRYRLVPKEDEDGRRCYLLVENPPVARDEARFTEREANVLRLSARGLTGKAVTYALGLSSSTVSEALRRAAAKVGLASRVELVRVAATLFGASSQSVSLEKLSSAEHEVLALLSRGLSNAEIAVRRQSSTRTVANQVSSILRKTGAAGRRALSARALP